MCRKLWPRLRTARSAIRSAMRIAEVATNPPASHEATHTRENACPDFVTNKAPAAESCDGEPRQQQVAQFVGETRATLRIVQAKCGKQRDNRYRARNHEQNVVFGGEASSGRVRPNAAAPAASATAGSSARSNAANSDACGFRSDGAIVARLSLTDRVFMPCASDKRGELATKARRRETLGIRAACRRLMGVDNASNARSPPRSPTDPGP